jgi:hypothetical protein
VDKNIITKNGKLNLDVFSSFNTELDSTSLVVLRGVLMKDFEDDFPVSGCFDPHHGIVMRDSKDSIVGHVSICFRCNNSRMSPFYVNTPMDSFMSLFRSKGLPISLGQINALRNEKNL